MNKNDLREISKKAKMQPLEAAWNNLKDRMIECAEHSNTNILIRSRYIEHDDNVLLYYAEEVINRLKSLGFNDSDIDIEISKNKSNQIDAIRINWE